MTITNPQIIAEMLRNGGSYQGDPVPATVWKFQTPDGQTNFAVFHEGEPCDIHSSPYVVEPVCLFHQQQCGVTAIGQDWLREQA